MGKEFNLKEIENAVDVLNKNGIRCPHCENVLTMNINFTLQEFKEIS